MAKTLVVKLAGTVDDNSLRRLGEMRIQINPTASTPYIPSPKPLPGHQFMRLTVNAPNQLELEGDGHFTDSTLTDDLGTTLTTQVGENNIYVSDSTSLLRIYDKNAITGMVFGTGHNEDLHYHWISDLKYLENMKNLASYTNHYGSFTENSSLANFKDIKTLTSLTVIQLFPVNMRMRGDLSDIAGLTNLEALNLWNQAPITGNISSIAGLTKLSSADLNGCTNLTGDTSSIAHLHPNNGGHLSDFRYTGTGITGTWPPASE